MTRPNFSGIWLLNSAKSKLAGPAISNLVMRIEHDEPRFAQIVKTLSEDEKVSLARFSGVTTGEEFQNPVHDRTVRSTASWTGKELIIESQVDADGRVLHFRDHWSLSECGHELRMEHRSGHLDGQIVVMDRKSSSDGA